LYIWRWSFSVIERTVVVLYTIPGGWSAIGKLASGFLVIHQLRAADIQNSAIKLRQPTFDSYRDRSPIPLSRIVGAKCQSARPKCMPNQLG
jgi:hypothetical protein